MKRLALALALLSGIAIAQPALVASKPCRMDGADCFSTAFSNITGISASRLIGRGSAGGTGAAQEITLGAGLTMSGTTLSPDVSGSGASGRITLWSGAGTLTSDAGLTYTGTGTGTVLRIGSTGTGLSEISAGVLGVGNGTAGDVSGTIKATTVDLGNNVTITSPSANVITFGTAKTDLTFYSLDGSTSVGFISGGAPYSNILAATLGGTSTNTVPLQANSFIVGSNYGSVTYATLTSAQLTLNGGGNEVHLRGESAAVLKHGAADSATPVAQTLTVQGGSGTNIAGQDWTQTGSLGTGNAASGKLVFKVGTPNSTGSVQHTANTVLTLQDTGTGGTPAPAVISAGPVTSTQFKLSALNTAPSSATDTGTLGEIRIDSGYIYVCTATNTWVRAALATWP